MHKENIPTNLYGDLFIRTNRNLNLRSRPVHKIPSIISELKGKNTLRYYNSVLWSCISCKMINLEND